MSVFNLHFDNQALQRLPVDKVEQNYVRTVQDACFSLVQPTPVDKPELVCYSKEAMELIGITEEVMEAHKDAVTEYFSGNKVLPGARPAAHCYCGHQFGNFSGQLGDGATMYLGEVLSKEETERWEMQFKGAGLTPYSRTADGRKVLRSSIREFLCSEAMHALGIPTTRAGTVVTSSTNVVRDVFYNGNPIHERATIILRIAPTFIRFGSFEIAKAEDPYTGRAGPSPGNKTIIRQLANYCIEVFFPHLLQESTPPTPLRDAVLSDSIYLAWFKEVVEKTAILVAEWQCVGFCHGVLNTDNMSIVGLTIDYGPYGFMEYFDKGFVCNGSDDMGRYSYKEQPAICRWNCGKLAEALHTAEILSADQTDPVLEHYDTVYRRAYYGKMLVKMGLPNKSQQGEIRKEDQDLVDSFVETMQQTGADWTNALRHLPLVKVEEETDHSPYLAYVLLQCPSREMLAFRYQPSIPPGQLLQLSVMAKRQPDVLLMMGVNPSFILKEVEKLEKMQELQQASEESLREKNHSVWCKWLEQYKQRLRAELTDTSEEERMCERTIQMNSVNPKYILRNYIAQRAIDKAEEGDFSEVRRVHQLLKDPFDLQETEISARVLEDACRTLQYDQPMPEWASELVVT